MAWRRWGACTASSLRDAAWGLHEWSWCHGAWGHLIQEGVGLLRVSSSYAVFSLSFVRAIICPQRAQPSWPALNKHLTYVTHLTHKNIADNSVSPWWCIGRESLSDSGESAPPTQQKPSWGSVKNACVVSSRKRSPCLEFGIGCGSPGWSSVCQSCETKTEECCPRKPTNFPAWSLSEDFISRAFVEQVFLHSLRHFKWWHIINVLYY